MAKPKGGRGKKAPYTSVTVRVPEDLKDTIDSLVNEYRQFILEGIKSQKNDVPSIDEIKELSKQLLKGRATRKDIVIELVTSIYGVEINKDELL